MGWDGMQSHYLYNLIPNPFRIGIEFVKSNELKYVIKFAYCVSVVLIAWCRMEAFYVLEFPF